METSAEFPSILAAPLCPSAGAGFHLIEFWMQKPTETRRLL